MPDLRNAAKTVHRGKFRNVNEHVLKDSNM